MRALSIQARAVKRRAISANSCVNDWRNPCRPGLLVAREPCWDGVELRNVTSISTGKARTSCRRNPSRITRLTVLRSTADLRMRFGTAIATRPLWTLFSLNLTTSSARLKRAPSRSNSTTSSLANRCFLLKRPGRPIAPFSILAGSAIAVGMGGTTPVRCCNWQAWKG